MRPEDLREMSRRLEEIMFIAERGYEPLYDETLGEWMWVKGHWGSVHTHAGALEEIGPRRGQGRVTQLQRLIITFKPDATLEFAITYAHGKADEPPSPGTKKRTTSAARMAAYGLQRALEGLDKGAPIWGGFATNTRTSRDTIIVDREESAA